MTRIVNSFGYTDGEVFDFERHLGVIKMITANVKIPVQITCIAC